MSAQLNNDYLHIKLALDAWAAWAREPSMGLGLPRINTIWRLMRYRTAIPPVAGLPPLVMPEHVERVDSALRKLSRHNERYYRAVRLSHLQRVPDRQLCGRVDVQTFRRWRRSGYKYLAECSLLG